MATKLSKGVSSILSMKRCDLSQFKCHLNANRAVISKIRRPEYVRTYPTLVVQPDGSTLTIRYGVPRQILKLPIDLDTCSEEEKTRIQFLRLKRETLNVVEDIPCTFDPNQYL